MNDPPLLNLIVALGVGLLVGAERERAGREHQGRSAAGLRTFAIAALAGAVAVAVGGAGLLSMTFLVIAALTALGYLRTAQYQGPGLTTEFALLLTVMTGGLAMSAPAAAGAVAVITTLLLAARRRLHHFVGSVISQDEVRSALILAASVIVIMPLLPDVQIGPYGALNPRKVWRLVVLVLLIGSGGHLATRLLGPRFGLPVSGLASGFVSSSATIGAMGSKAATSPESMAGAVAGAVLSTVATVVQMALVVGATSQAALGAMAAPLIGAGLCALAYGAVFTVIALRRPVVEGGDVGEAFRLSTALIFAATLSVVLVVSAALREWFGESGVIAAAGVAGFADTHSPAISTASLVAAGHLTAEQCVVPILAGFTTNTITKIAVAWTAGGRAFAMRVVPGVLLVAAGAWIGALVSAAGVGLPGP